MMKVRCVVNAVPDGEMLEACCSVTAACKLLLLHNFATHVPT
jgi:hypothetical protein